MTSSIIYLKTRAAYEEEYMGSVAVLSSHWRDALYGMSSNYLALFISHAISVCMTTGNLWRHIVLGIYLLIYGRWRLLCPFFSSVNVSYLVRTLIQERILSRSRCWETLFHSGLWTFQWMRYTMQWWGIWKTANSWNHISYVCSSTSCVTP